MKCLKANEENLKMIYDISQDITNCKIYPGDNKPIIKETKHIDTDKYNLTEFSMCAHNGTHVDAPKHFIKDGKGIDEISLDKFIGECIVYEFNGEMKKEDAIKVLNKANGIKKILIKGNAVISLEAAKEFADNNIDLIGNESQSIGPLDAPMAVHLVLLNKEIVLLEGIRLENIKEGNYILNCAPINLGNCDGAPCRAILIDK